MLIYNDHNSKSQFALKANYSWCNEWISVHTAGWYLLLHSLVDCHFCCFVWGKPLANWGTIATYGPGGLIWIRGACRTWEGLKTLFRCNHSMGIGFAESRDQYRHEHHMIFFLHNSNQLNSNHSLTSWFLPENARIAWDSYHLNLPSSDDTFYAIWILGPGQIHLCSLVIAWSLNRQFQFTAWNFYLLCYNFAPNICSCSVLLRCDFFTLMIFCTGSWSDSFTQGQPKTI